MIRSFTVASFLTAAVLAQSTPPTNPLIPQGISQGCSTFLQGLDSDSSSFSCLTSLVSVLTNFGPGRTATSSVAALTSSLDTLCSTTSCAASIYRTKIADFQSACSNELVATPNQAVVKIYDALYTLKPLRDAVCLKDDSGRYCVTEPTTSTTSTSTSSSSSVAASTTHPPTRRSDIDRRAPGDTPSYAPNESTWTQNNIAFLLLQPSLPANLLCTTCTRGILGAWIAFESEAPYAPGLSQSTLLSGQTDLYNAIQSKCGASFLSGTVQAAGGLANSGPFGHSSTSSARSVSTDMLSSLAVVLASFAAGSAAML